MELRIARFMQVGSLARGASVAWVGNRAFGELRSRTWLSPLPSFGAASPNCAPDLFLGCAQAQELESCGHRLSCPEDGVRRLVVAV